MSRIATRLDLNGYIAAFAAAGIALHLALSYALATPRVGWIPLWATLVAGGVLLVWELARRLFRREFGSGLLAGLSGGTALEEAATRRASSVLRALVKRMPQRAHRVSDSGVADVPLDRIGIRGQVVVFPHGHVPWMGKWLKAAARWTSPT